MFFEREGAGAIGGHFFAVDVCFQDVHVLKVVDDDKIGWIIDAQEADRQLVMCHRVEAGALQDVKQVVSEDQGAFDHAVDMAVEEFVWMFVVTAEHDAVWVL